MTNILKEEASFNKYQSSQKTSALRRSHPFQALATRAGGELVDAKNIHRLSTSGGSKEPALGQAQNLEDMKRVSEIARAMMNYESTNIALPPAQRSQGEVIPLKSTCLSWRVHLLPYLGQLNLYKQFRLEEPWDSPHNQQLIGLMPDCYRLHDDEPKTTVTRLQVATGPGTLFPELGKPVRSQYILDGAANTLLVMAVPKSLAVNWTQPVDFNVDLTAQDYTQQLEVLRVPQGVVFAFANTAVSRMPPDIYVHTIKALFSPDGKEAYDRSRFQP
jgi:Protein of unknown function (DUF1559)